MQGYPNFALVKEVRRDKNQLQGHTFPNNISFLQLTHVNIVEHLGSVGMAQNSSNLFLAMLNTNQGELHKKNS